MVPFLHSPSLSYEHGIITVTSFEDDIPLLAEIQDRAYLAINEPEYCLDDNHRRFQADAAESFTIQNEFAGLGAEPYLYWWEDVYGTILSDIKLFDLSSAESPVALIQNQDSSFNEQMRQYNLYRYQQHLVPYLIGHSSEENKDKNYNLLQNSLAVAEEDTDCDSSSLARHILQWNCTSDNLYNFSSFASVMMQDFILYSRFRTDFFQQPFIYWDKQDTVVLPSGNEEILYKIEKYSISNGYTAEYMRAQQDTATEYRITNAEYAFVTAINTEEMRISGFLMIDFSRGLFAAELSRFMLPDVEVKHY